MKVNLYIWCFFFLPFLSLQAQITLEDFPRIQFLSGGDSLYFNPEIRYPGSSGNFIITNPGYPELILSLPDLPILKDFSEYIRPDSPGRILHISQLPAYIIMKTGLGDIYHRYVFKSFLLNETEIDQLRQLYLLSFQPLFDPVYSIRTLEGGVGTRFYAEEILRQIFRKSEWAKSHNRRYATAYKFYNLLPLE